MYITYTHAHQFIRKQLSIFTNTRTTLYDYSHRTHRIHIIAQSNRACCVSSKLNKMCIPFVVFQKREERQRLACSSVVVNVVVYCAQRILAHNLPCHFPLCFGGVAITAGLTAAGTGKRLSSATVWRHHRVISG